MPKTVAGNVPCNMAELFRLMNDPEDRYLRIVARAANQVIAGSARAKLSHTDVFNRLAATGTAGERDRGAVYDLLDGATDVANATHGVRAVLNACPRVASAVQKRVRWR